MGVMSFKGGGGEKRRPGVMPKGGLVEGREHEGVDFLIPAMFDLHETKAVR